ncbi:MAG: prepilin-type N-terminal cleavage/methylation domain-containing protein [Candidatus Taylorbacteria bacterium]|nr:prepilin-type N-terminal cleavage/methylation domain-containing protein [Candidatus Taylorbacteria bacterium]
MNTVNLDNAYLKPKQILHSQHSNGNSQFSHRARGFTLLEMLVVLALAGIVTLVVTGVFSKAAGREALDKETAVVLSLLDQARSQTLSAKNSSVYGVHFEAAKAVLFAGPVYSSSDASNVIEPMNPLVQISAITLAGGGSEVLFKALTGETAQSGTVVLSLAASPTQSKSITIFATGIAFSN